GGEGCDSPRPTSPGSGRRTATTITAILGSSSATRETDLAARARGRARGGDPADQELGAGAPGLARPSRRPARRRPADRRGRLPGPTELLDRHGTGGSPPGADRRTTR